MSANPSLNPHELIKKVLEGINLNEEEESAILGMYKISMYKAMLEVLITLHSKDTSFRQNLSDFFNNSYETLSDHDKEGFDLIIEKEKKKVLKNILIMFAQQLQESEKIKILDKIKTNLE